MSTSKQGGPFPTEDAKFNEYLQRAVPHLLKEWNRLVPQLAPGVPPPPPPPIAYLRKDELDTGFKRWNIVYPLAKNPDISSNTAIDDKNDSRKQMESLLRYIYADIPSSWLLNSDRNTLNLPRRDREPSPHPQIVDPIIGLTAQGGGDIEVRCRVTKDETRPSKPLPHILVQVKYILKDADDKTIPPFEDCTLLYENSHALSIMHLGIQNVGKRFYGYFRWYDPIHPEDSGQWTEAHTIVVA